MLTTRYLVYAVIAVPLLAALTALLSGPDLSERYHAHHDTFSVSRVVSRTLVLVMVFMGVLGGLIVWLCHLGVFRSDPEVPLAFFLSFQLTLLVAFVAVSRWQVMTYGDQMFVRPSVGRRRDVPYDQIAAMRRRRSLINPNFDDLLIRLSSGRIVRVSGLLDVEQILVRIDRFDVLEG